MPLYSFKCNCGHKDEEYRPMAEFDKTKRCSRCSGRMRIDIVAQKPAVRGDYKKPIISDSMAFAATSDEVAKHRELFPDVDLDVEDGMARPVLKSLGQKRKYLAASGWEDKNSYV